jgi:hypothetical protein
MITRAQALRIREWIERFLASCTDAEASEVPVLYPALKYDGALIPYKSRRQFGGKLYIAQYDTYDYEHYDPAHDTNGWAELMYREGHRIIPETMTTATMFAKNELGWWGDTLYRSKIDNNSWTPTAYPDGWEVVS